MTDSRDRTSKALATRDALTRALHRHTCGTDWDEWNQPCAWAGEDWDPENGPAACAYIGEIGVEDAVFAWVATLADDEALVGAIERIEESRQTHIEWRDHWRKYNAHSCEQSPCPWESAREAEEAIAGDMEHQERAIAGYDAVLTILRTLAAALTERAS